MSQPPTPSFLVIVQIHQLQAMLHLGMVPNPATGTPNPVNTERAMYEITLLEILREKTEGNLSEQEQALLDEVISTLHRAAESLG